MKNSIVSYRSSTDGVRSVEVMAGSTRLDERLNLVQHDGQVAEFDKWFGFGKRQRPESRPVAAD